MIFLDGKEYYDNPVSGVGLANALEYCNLVRDSQYPNVLHLVYGEEREVSLSDTQTLTIKPINIYSFCQVGDIDNFKASFMDNLDLYTDKNLRRVKNFKSIPAFLKPFMEHYRSKLGEEWDGRKIQLRFLDMFSKGYHPVEEPEKGRG